MAKAESTFSFFPYTEITPAHSVGGEAIRVLQITDCHLGEQVGEKLVGMDTDQSLDLVLALLVQEQLSNTQTKPELLLATGDLSNHGTAAAYRRLQQKLLPLNLPNAWLPGNHDSYDLMVDTVGESQLPRLINIGSWYIFMLDSAVPGQVSGELGANQLEALAQVFLRLPAEANFLLCLHHQPVSIGSNWLDKQMIADESQLMDLLSGEARLRAVVWGHIHQAFEISDPRLPNVALMGTPSTCVQFEPENTTFKVDPQQPGYRWLDLYPDGKIKTGVSRANSPDLSLDLDSSGY